MRAVKEYRLCLFHILIAIDNAFFSDKRCRASSDETQAHDSPIAPKVLVGQEVAPMELRQAVRQAF